MIQLSEFNIHQLASLFNLLYVDAVFFQMLVTFNY